MTTTFDVLKMVAGYVYGHWAIFGALFALLLNDLAIALTKYPKSQSFIQAVRDIIAPHAHKDSEGQTLKVPFFQRSKPTAGAKEFSFKKIPLSPPPLPPAALLVLFLLPLASCATFWGAAKACSGEEYERAKAHVGDTVIDLLEHGTGDIESELTNLGFGIVGDGPAILRCLITEWRNKASARLALVKSNREYLPPTEAWLVGTQGEIERGIERADAWLAHK